MNVIVLHLKYVKAGSMRSRPSRTRPGFVGDGRYALLPTRIAPIWRLEWSADEAPAFVTRREVTSEIRQAFIAMLLGR